MFDNRYDGKRVLVTGHTGFKGSWLCAWLQSLGARVTGVGLAPPTTPNHFDLLDLDLEAHHVADLRDREGLARIVKESEPEILFHMAAQPLVRFSYDHPIETFDTNVMGTLNLYEACRGSNSLQGIVTITSDKVYKNLERPEGYDESDRLGGADPYSCSKACAELLTDCYRGSFFSGDGSPLIATVRAGNVIGGGDWALDRIVADVAQAASQGRPTPVRNPHAVRPWQHVLEPLAGYLMVGSRLLQRDESAATAWNFGPRPDGMVCVGDLVAEMAKHWEQVAPVAANETNAPKETNVLTLRSDKSENELAWRPVWDFPTTIEKVATWYRVFYDENRVLTHNDLDAYLSDASRDGLAWTAKQVQSEV